MLLVLVCQVCRRIQWVTWIKRAAVPCSYMERGSMLLVLVCQVCRQIQWSLGSTELRYLARTVRQHVACAGVPSVPPNSVVT